MNRRSFLQKFAALAGVSVTAKQTEPTGAIPLKRWIADQPQNTLYGRRWSEMLAGIEWNKAMAKMNSIE